MNEPIPKISLMLLYYYQATSTESSVVNLMVAFYKCKNNQQKVYVEYS